MSLILVCSWHLCKEIELDLNLFLAFVQIRALALYHSDTIYKNNAACSNCSDQKLNSLIRSVLLNLTLFCQTSLRVHQVEILSHECLIISSLELSPMTNPLHDNLSLPLLKPSVHGDQVHERRLGGTPK